MGLWPLGHLGPLPTPDAPNSCPGLPPAKAPDGSEPGPPQRAAWGVTAGGWGSLRRMLGEGREQGEGKGGGRSLGPGLEQRLRQRQDLGPQLKGPWAGAGIGTCAGAHISGQRSQSLPAQESLSRSQGSCLCRSSTVLEPLEHLRSFSRGRKVRAPRSCVGTAGTHRGLRSKVVQSPNPPGEGQEGWRKSSPS